MLRALAGAAYDETRAAASKRHTASRTRAMPAASHVLANPRVQLLAIAFAFLYQLCVMSSASATTPHRGWVSISPYRGMPVVAVGVMVAAAAHLFLDPRDAGSVSFVSLVLVMMQRCLVTCVAPTHVLFEQLHTFEVCNLHTHALAWTLLGASITTHAQTTRMRKRRVLVLVNLLIAIRAVVWCCRTGDSMAACGPILYLCVPFCMSYRFAQPATAMAIAYGLQGLRWAGVVRPAHGPCLKHVDTLCATCDELLAVYVLQPCGLGVCPTCAATITCNVDCITCPTCHEHVRCMERIWHVDDVDDALKRL